MLGQTVTNSEPQKELVRFGACYGTMLSYILFKFELLKLCYGQGVFVW